MKTRTILLLVSLSLCTGWSADLKINWFSIGCGSGTSGNGSYEVKGTIGQPDAGCTLTGGDYALSGGFWSVIAAVQQPEAPLLSVEGTATNSVVISWPAPSTGWQLEENPDLGPANWLNMGQSPQEIDGRMQIIVSPPIGKRFYRLHK